MLANTRKIRYAQEAYQRIHETDACPANIDGVCCEKCQNAYNVFSDAFDALPIWFIILAMVETAISHPIKAIKAWIETTKARRNYKHNIPRKGSKSE